MKRHLIYHTHVITNGQQENAIRVQTRALGSDMKSEETSCLLDRISRDGMTLSCDESSLHQLMPKKSCAAPKNPLSIATNFCLEGNIQANCRVVFARRLSKNQFILELKFFELAEKDMNLIDQFVEKSLNRQQNSGRTSLSEDKTTEKATSSANNMKPSLHHLKVNTKPVFSKVA